MVQKQILANKGMITRVIISTLTGCILAVLIVIPLQAHNLYKKVLTSQAAIINRKDTGITIQDRQGRSFFHFYDAKSKHVVPLNEVPLTAQQAVIAIEDQSFYTNFGISPRGIIRSAITNMKAGRILYGGSTITQQLIKNSLLTTQKSWLRKYEEVWLALELEARYTKADILTMYFNSAYFGEGAFGIEEAAQTYFNKPAKALTLGESSLLAGLLTSPSTLSPLSHEPKQAINRQRLVLQNMLEQGYITPAQKNAAANEPLIFNTTVITRNAAAPHFAIYVRDQLITQYGEPAVAASGFTVTTTLDLDIQAQAEAALNQQLAAIKYRGAGNGAVVVMDPTTHQILAMVGSSNWFSQPYGKMNMAISPRQPGSSFKPIVYAAAFDAHLITPATILMDVPTNFGLNYKPSDYDGKFRGPVTVRRALANSLNIPAVSTMQKVGVPAVMQLVRNLGITSLNANSNQNLALALGAGEVSLLDMTNVYATLADQGNFLPAQSILSIKDKSNHLVASTAPTPQAVITPQTAFLLSSIMSDATARAEIFGRTLDIHLPAAVKTGTSQNYRDAWTLGYTPTLTIGVWIGNNDNKPMTALAGALGAAPVWKNLMTSLSVGKPLATFTLPDNITVARLCQQNEFFLTGTEVRRSCPTPSPSVAPTPVQITQTQPKPVH
jgi:1A family penicillin-binding protein